MNEQELLQAAKGGNVLALIELAKYYAEKSDGTRGDKVGDVMTKDDFLKSLTNPEGDGDFEKLAYKYWLMAAEAGIAVAMTEVGRRLYDGIGVEKDAEASDKWYRRGAEAGDPSAMRVVAFISEDDAEKFKWYKLSAELDEPGLNKQDSIKQTAINYAAGKGTDKDVAKAEEWLGKLDDESASEARRQISQLTGESSWLERAAETSIDAMIEMAEHFVLKNDFVTALKWYEKAVANGSPDAMSLIGDIHYIGEDGVAQDYTAAFEWYSKAAARGHNMAYIKLTLMLYRGRGVEQDLPCAFENFAKISWTKEPFFGVMRFNSVARYYAAKMQEDGEGCEKNLDDAPERYRLAGGLERVSEYESPRRIPKALYKVADAHFLGKGTRQNFKKARTFYEKTFSDGDGRTPYHMEAAKKLMWMYELGEGVEQDAEQAAKWREKIQ